MRSVLQFGVLACALMATLIVFWIGYGGDRRRRELDSKGAVIVTGDGASSFAIQYREAADLVAQGKVSEAESLYMDLTNKEPSSPNGYVGLASCALERQDVTTARKLYKTALAIEPRSVNALIGLGSSYSMESDYTNAATNYEQALAVDEESPEGHWGLAVAYAQLGRQAEAINHLSRFKKLAPDSRHIASLEKIVGFSVSQPVEHERGEQP